MKIVLDPGNICLYIILMISNTFVAAKLAIMILVLDVFWIIFLRKYLLPLYLYFFFILFIQYVVREKKYF